MRGNKGLRWIDACLGRVLIFVFRLFKKKQPFPQRIESIGLLKLFGIGDLILLSGIVQDIFARYPESKIILFCGTDNAEIARLIPGIHEIVPLPFLAVRRLWQRRPTILFDFGQWSRIDALFAYLSGSSYTIGFQTAGQQRHNLYDATSVHSSSVHEIENFRALVAKGGVKSLTPPTLRLQEEPVSSEFLKKEPLIIFHPWPSGLKSELKKWPLNSWMKLGEILLQNGYYVLISGSRANFEESQELEEKINASAKIGRALNGAGKLSLSQLGHLMQKAKCVISVNTGVMHLASCFETLLIALHGPTSVNRWGPLGSQAVALSSECAECGYLNLGFEYPKEAPPCMEKITLSKVLEVLTQKNLIKRQQ